jgi:Tol biopolymer transport system component
MNGGMRWIAGAIAVAAAVSLPATALAVFPGENGQIAFVSGRDMPNPPNDLESDVFLLDAAGDLTPTKLTLDAGQHRHPAWSPDLEKLAYARWASQSDNQKIFIDDLSVGGPVSLRLGPHDSSVLDDRPAWSPDGTRIAYESEVTNGSNQMDILVVNVETGALLNLTNTNAANPPIVTEGKPVWSPDGRFIYYHTNATGDQDIRRERSNGSQAVPDTIVGDAGNQFQPALSPDGTELCYTEGAFNNTANVIKRTVASGGTEIEISAEGNNVADYNCAWSPEGDKITFVTGLLSAGELVIKNSDDTGPITPVTTNDAGHFDGNPDWAPKKPAFCQDRAATIAGTDAGETLFGTKRKDVIQGHGGPDRIIGRGGNDVICGGGGPDRLNGAEGKDTLFGGGGADVLNGGKGRDRCVGRRSEKKNCEK